MIFQPQRKLHCFSRYRYAKKRGQCQHALDFVSSLWQWQRSIEPPRCIALAYKAARSARNAGIVQRKSPIRDARNTTTLRGDSGKRAKSPGVKALLIASSRQEKQIAQPSREEDRGRGHQPSRRRSTP